LFFLFFFCESLFVSLGAKAFLPRPNISAGGDLKEALGGDSTGQLGWYQQGGQFLCDIARGLHFLHSNKVAHRLVTLSRL
jgi:hypothetical protein